MDGLPIELLAIIMSRFHPRIHFLVFSRVCRRWRSAVAGILTHLRLPDSLTLPALLTKLTSLTINACHVSASNVSSLSRLEHLEITAPPLLSNERDAWASLNLPRLSSLALHCIPGPDVSELLERHAAQLTHLALLHLSETLVVRLTQLRSLVWEEIRSPLHVHMELLGACTALTQLHLRTGRATEIFQVHHWAELRHLTSLHLSARLTPVAAVQLLQQCRALTSVSLCNYEESSSEVFEVLAPVLRLLDLTVERGAAYGAFPGIASCRQLTRLVFHSGFLRDENVSSHWTPLVRALAPQLRHVEVPCVEHLGRHYRALLARLTNLTSVRVTLTKPDDASALFEHWPLPVLGRLALDTGARMDLPVALPLVASLVRRFRSLHTIELLTLSINVHGGYSSEQLEEISMCLALLTRLGIRSVRWCRLQRAAGARYVHVLCRHSAIDLDGS